MKVMLMPLAMAAMFFKTGISCSVYRNRRELVPAPAVQPLQQRRSFERSWFAILAAVLCEFCNERTLTANHPRASQRFQTTTGVEAANRTGELTSSRA